MSWSWVSCCRGAVLMKYAPGLVLAFEGNNRFVGKQIIAQLLVESRVAAANPLQHHRGVFLFLVTVVREDGAQLLVLAGIDPLVVPVHRSEEHTSELQSLAYLA